MFEITIRFWFLFLLGIHFGLSYFKCVTHKCNKHTHKNTQKDTYNITIHTLKHTHKHIDSAVLVLC